MGTHCGLYENATFGEIWGYGQHCDWAAEIAMLCLIVPQLIVEWLTCRNRPLKTK